MEEGVEVEVEEGSSLFLATNVSAPAAAVVVAVKTELLVEVSHVEWTAEDEDAGETEGGGRGGGVEEYLTLFEVGLRVTLLSGCGLSISPGTNV